MSDVDFQKRREAGRKRLDEMDKNFLEDGSDREQFFTAVYAQANGDEAAIPWADMEAKQYLKDWLTNNKPNKGKAIDIGCGLGDNAEAISSAGYKTIGFDFSQDAIDWAKKRFHKTSVQYVAADLMSLPEEWSAKFDFVHESYTLQSIPPDTLAKTIPATASLVAPGGRLLVYTRIRNDGKSAEGPPWPLEISKAMSFEKHGLELASRNDFVVRRHDREVPHVLCEWRRPT